MQFATIKVNNNYGYDTEQYELVPNQEIGLPTWRRQLYHSNTTDSRSMHRSSNMYRQKLQKIQMQGDKQTLMVWAIGKDGVTAFKYDSETIYGAVFGDKVCLAQVYQSCS